MAMHTVISISGLLKLCCWTSSLPQRLQTWNLIQRHPFLLRSPFQWMNLQKYFSLKIHQADIEAPTHQTFCLLCRFHRDFLLHIPPHKVKTVQTTTLIWVYFPQMIRQLLTMKTLPKCFNQANNIWQWKGTSLPMIYFIKYTCGGFGKMWIRKFIYVIFCIFYHSIFACLALRWRGNITSHSPLTCSILISGNVENSLTPFDYPKLKPPDPLVM